MKRTINSTGRQKLPQDAVVIRLREPTAEVAGRSFTAHFPGLDALELPRDARIYVEPYVAQSSMRFPFGSVGLPESPADTICRELDDGRVLFRVKIVDESDGTGRILAVANELSPRGQDDDESRRPLLPIRRTDLGEELWQLKVLRDSGPELWISNRVPGLADRIPTDPLAQGLVLPHVLRMLIPDLFDTEDSAQWQRDWQLCINRMVGEELDWDRDFDEEELENLIERAVRAFSDRQKYASKSKQLHEERADG